jgi:2-methylcitrate dehydratase PrpD
VVLHALIDACLGAREKIKEAEKLVVSLHPLAIERTDRPEPRNAIEAKLSAQHAVAVALLRGRAGLEEFSDAAAADPALKAFRRRVSVIPGEGLDKMAAIISDGKTTVRNDAAKPMDEARIEAKFRELAGSRAPEWIRFVDSLDSLHEVSLPADA